MTGPRPICPKCGSAAILTVASNGGKYCRDRCGHIGAPASFRDYPKGTGERTQKSKFLYGDND